jgi:methylmalonyl-CoA/ethylmalonyl-CoA epimerase
MHSGASASAVHLDDIAQIAITVSDLERSKDFYQNVLGLRFLFDASTMTFFQCGGIRLALGTSPDLPSSAGTILYFRVADIQAAHDLLVSRGVEFIQKPHLVAKLADRDLWLAFLSDPDKQPIGLMCEMPRSDVPETN